MRGLLLCVAIALVGCGPSVKEIRAAKLALYKGPGSQLYDMALAETQATYKIGEVDPGKLQFATAPQWYDAEGGRHGTTNEGNGDYVNARGGSVELSLIVDIETISPNHYAITVTPKTLQLVSGSPQPRELSPEDPYLPPWVAGRVDALAIALFNRGRNLRW